MLVLGRKNGQKVLLWTSDGLIEVKFKEFVNGNAYIGFEAPKAVHIVREELANHKARGRLSAADKPCALPHHKSSRPKGEA